jgi:hypothetical protein
MPRMQTLEGSMRQTCRLSTFKVSDIIIEATARNNMMEIHRFRPTRPSLHACTTRDDHPDATSFG